MEYIAEIIVPLKLRGSEFISAQRKLEVSLDCSICKRSRRTIVFDAANNKMICISSKDYRHDFHGEFLDLIVEDEQKFPQLVYKIHYSYSEFFDDKGSQPSVPHPTWARVYYSVKCKKCGEITEKSTQNNIRRPSDIFCSCGNLLLVEDVEMPIFKLYDLNKNLLYSHKESHTLIYIYSKNVPVAVENTFVELAVLTREDFYSKIESNQPVYYQAAFHISDPLVYSQNLQKMIFSLIEANSEFDVLHNGRSIKPYFTGRYHES